MDAKEYEENRAYYLKHPIADSGFRWRDSPPTQEEFIKQQKDVSNFGKTIIIVILIWAIWTFATTPHGSWYTPTSVDSEIKAQAVQDAIDNGEVVRVE